MIRPGPQGFSHSRRMRKCPLQARAENSESRFPTTAQHDAGPLPESENNGQRFQATQVEVVPVIGVLRPQPQSGEAAPQRVEGHLCL